MIKRIEEKILLEPAQIPSSDDRLEVIGVFNPGAIRFGSEICLLVRVAERARESRPGFFSSPRKVRCGKKWEIEIDWFPASTDSRDMRSFDTGGGRSRLAFISHLRLVKLDKTGFNITMIDEMPTFFPEEEYEEFGVEDPRITDIDGKFFITYVACSRKLGICTALAETHDFRQYVRRGIIFPMENKDVVLLPERICGDYLAYHRPGGSYKFDYLSMQTARSSDLLHWGRHSHLLAPRPGFWDEFKLGGGCVPLRTEQGWLEIYHGVRMEEPDDPVGIYCAGAALFDLNDPGRLIGRSREPVLMPENACEKNGFVPNVIFPTACIPDIEQGYLLMFCGAADEQAEVIKVSLEEILAAIEAL